MFMRWGNDRNGPRFSLFEPGNGSATYSRSRQSASGVTSRTSAQPVRSTRFKGWLRSGSTDETGQDRASNSSSSIWETGPRSATRVCEILSTFSRKP